MSRRTLLTSALSITLLLAEVKLPLYRSLANTQLDSPAILQFGISRSF